MYTLTRTDFNFPGQLSVYHGKVRDVYDINDDILVMVATDRISAFDVILPKGIPFKGQVLNQIATYFLDATADAVPNWKMATPDPMVTVGAKCEGMRVEMIIRGYLTGSAWLGATYTSFSPGRKFSLLMNPNPSGMTSRIPLAITPLSSSDGNLSSACLSCCLSAPSAAARGSFTDRSVPSAACFCSLAGRSVLSV